MDIIYSVCSSKGTALTCLLGVLRHVQRMIAREASTKKTPRVRTTCRFARHACARGFEHKPPCDTSPLAPLLTVNKKSLLPVPHQQDTHAFETGGERDEDRITGNKIWYLDFGGFQLHRDFEATSVVYGYKDPVRTRSFRESVPELVKMLQTGGSSRNTSVWSVRLDVCSLTIVE